MSTEGILHKFVI